LNARLLKAETGHESFHDVRGVGVGPVLANPYNQRAGFKEIDTVPNFLRERQVADVEIWPALEVEMCHGRCLVRRRVGVSG
jgi:hypothetical protein